MNTEDIYKRIENTFEKFGNVLKQPGSAEK